MAGARVESWSIDEIRERQLSRLRDGLRTVLRDNSFYRERLHDVNGWDDFERLPFTSKADFIDDQAHRPPFGTNLTFPLDRYVRVHQTSGTTSGRPMRWLDTAESWEWCERLWSDYIFPAAGVRPGDRVFLAFSFGPFLGFWSAFGGAQRLGAMAISGGQMGTEQRVEAMITLGATVLCSTPTYALRLGDTARNKGVDLAASPLRVTIHAGEPGAGIPATRDAIEASFGAMCYDHTGMTELGPSGVSCPQRDGVHLLEPEFIFEVVDGELVATNLGRWGSPLIRYRTGDRVELSREPCSCGNPFAKIVGGIRGRVDDMFTIRGVNVYPSQVEAVVRRYAEITEFLIECRTSRHMDEVTLLIEADERERGIAERIERDLRGILSIRLPCRLVDPGALPRSEMKSKRLIRVSS